MQKIMLTGSNGYIGSKIHAALKAKADIEVFTFDEFGDKERWEQRFAQAFNQPFDMVIHAGAIMDSMYTEEDIFWWNYHTTTEVARYCQRHDSFMLFFSTCQAITAISHYGWSKRCASDFVESNVKDHCIVRPFIVYGDEYGRPSKYSAVAKLIRGELPVMFEPWVRDWIHVRDIIRAIGHIVDNRYTGIYDLGTGEGISARTLFEHWGEPLPPVAGPNHPDYPEKYPTVIVAEKLLPSFQIKYHILDYLDEMKKYGNKLY